MESALKTPRKEKRLVLMHHLQERLGGRTRQYIYNLEKAGKLPKGIKLGRSRAWFAHDIDEWFDKLEAAA